MFMRVSHLQRERDPLLPTAMIIGTELRSTVGKVAKLLDLEPRIACADGRSEEAELNPTSYQVPHIRVWLII